MHGDQVYYRYGGRAMPRKAREKVTDLFSEKIIDGHPGLFKDGTQGAFGHVAGMVGKGGESPVVELNQISCDPAACRSNTNPAFFSRLMI